MHSSSLFLRIYTAPKNLMKFMLSPVNFKVVQSKNCSIHTSFVSHLFLIDQICLKYSEQSTVLNGIISTLKKLFVLPTHLLSFVSSWAFLNNVILSSSNSLTIWLSDCSSVWTFSCNLNFKRYKKSVLPISLKTKLCLTVRPYS